MTRQDGEWQRKVPDITPAPHIHTPLFTHPQTHSHVPLSPTRAVLNINQLSSFYDTYPLFLLWKCTLAALNKRKKFTSTVASPILSDLSFIIWNAWNQVWQSENPFSVEFKPGVVGTEQNPVGGLPPLSQCLGSGKLICCTVVLVLLGGEKVLFFMMNHLGDFSVRKLNYFLH